MGSDCNRDTEKSELQRKKLLQEGGAERSTVLEVMTGNAPEKRCLRFPLHWFKWKIVFDKVLTSKCADVGV